jgi:predicted DCC family thiol-disulfide oxidoreductase YuxK
VAFVKRLDRAQRIDVQPWQTPGLLERVRLTAEQTSDAAWFVDPTGKPHRAVAALSQALAHISPVFAPLPWLYRLPGLKQLADAAYKWVANNRYRLPGASAACQIPATKVKPRPPSETR